MTELPKEDESTKIRFFRDLFEVERRKLLIEFGALPPGAAGEMNHGAEYALYRWIAGTDRLPQMVEAMDKIIQGREADPYSPWPDAKIEEVLRKHRIVPDMQCPHAVMEFVSIPGKRGYAQTRCAACYMSMEDIAKSEGFMYAPDGIFGDDNMNNQTDLQDKHGTHVIVSTEDGEDIATFHMFRDPVEGRELDIVRKVTRKNGVKESVFVAYRIIKVGHVMTQGYDGTWTEMTHVIVKSIEGEIND